MWDELLSGGEAAIERLLGRQEDLTLEFKANDLREPIFLDGSLSPAGKKILAKEASAFSNSAGGVIVFGVDCRSTDGIDQAELLTPISSLARAETSVRDAAAEFLQPRHTGIEVARIPSLADPTSGYIIVRVPRSDRRPHRSEAKGQKEYFKRIGSRSYPMEHYDIEDAFRRTTSPILILDTSFQESMSIGMTEKVFSFQFGLMNEGEVSAKSVSLQIWSLAGEAFGTSHYSTSRNEVSNYRGRQYIGAPSDFVIHPHETRMFHEFQLRLKRNPTSGEVRLGNSLLRSGCIRFCYAIGAENMRVAEQKCVLSDEQLAPLLNAHWG
ncbi:AlbA family DNA-binding domain-containing protein [Rhizobium multihospitium]|uniref:Putative DNA-binding domain-containing protein n=1 Tax=Rhizobium multihospitium TaxID=410764 RepID=A0A1C3WNT6_9HYPH|nr:ATP-binding protein [Rhizobium multihospitium]SCB41595.1 Putative DNA-binding domain-containing protein [Rhizobium multihospitium]